VKLKQGYEKISLLLMALSIMLFSGCDKINNDLKDDLSSALQMALSRLILLNHHGDNHQN
jgi:hypothetical protein